MIKPTIQSWKLANRRARFVRRDANEMRLASYNILDGGEGRADPLAEVLIAQRADIIGVVEADNPAVLQRLSYRLKMDHVVAVGHGHAAALFSRWRIGNTVNHALLGGVNQRSFLTVEVEVPAWSQPLVVGVVHLHPRADDADESVRENQVAAILAAFEPARNSKRPHILLGDFNSNSPIQQIDPAKCKESTEKSWKNNGERLPRRVIQLLLDAGFVDTLATADLRAAESVGTFTTQSPGQRVDYIFAHGFDRSQIKAAWIEQDRLAKFASDHFPVGCEIA